MRSPLFLEVRHHRRVVCYHQNNFPLEQRKKRFDGTQNGLHFEDIAKLLDSFNELVDNGHSVIIIEHNLDVIKCADHIIDIGPEGGFAGGQVVAQGTPEDIARVEESYTGKYLKTVL